jgi:hypothetical protein
MVDTPKELRPNSGLVYPPHNHKNFEQYFCERFISEGIETNLEYIPVLWTNFYVENGFGTKNLHIIQSFIDSLDKKKSYFTVVQYDDNIINKLDGLDIKIFNLSGKGAHIDKCYDIPLICTPPPNLKHYERKEIFASFIGRMTNSLRSDLVRSLSGNPKYVIEQSSAGTDYHNYNSFREIMAKSLFSLCPRGYGPTSFRVCEALQSGSIPVIISDHEEHRPFFDEIDLEDFSVVLKSEQISNLDQILSGIDESRILTYQQNGSNFYGRYYEFSSCFDRIIEKVNR